MPRQRLNIVSVDGGEGTLLNIVFLNNTYRIQQTIHLLIKAKNGKFEEIHNAILVGR